MIGSLFASGMDIRQIFIEIIIRLPAAILAICFHESAHAYVAYKCGDPTAKIMGRVSMNPRVHFDPLGIISMLAVGFGWARPVPINPNNFRHFRRDTALTALAGPVSNFILALISLFIYFVIYISASYNNVGYSSYFNTSDTFIRVISIVLRMVLAVATMNLSLMLFNLIPIPPLDGSKVLFAFLPTKAYDFILRYERYGFLILFALLMSGIIDKPLGIAFDSVFSLMIQLFYWFFGLFGLL